MSRIRNFGRIFLNYRQVELGIAEVVYLGQNNAFKRAIDAVDKQVLEKTLQTVMNAVSSSILQSGLTADQKARTKKVCVTSMPHVSDEDPLDHSTMYGLDENGQAFWVAHAPSDSNKQQPARNTNRTDTISGEQLS